MPYKDKEKQKQNRKEYYLKNKEKLAKQNKEWALKNKDKHKLYQNEYQKEYRKTDYGKKKITILGWKARGMVFDNKEEAEFYYQNWIKSTNCNWCDKKYKSSQGRALDHCHDCGRPRAIICNSCNEKDIVPCVLCLNS